MHYVANVYPIDWWPIDLQTNDTTWIHHKYIVHFTANEKQHKSSKAPEAV